MEKAKKDECEATRSFVAHRNVGPKFNLWMRLEGVGPEERMALTHYTASLGTFM